MYRVKVQRVNLRSKYVNMDRLEVSRSPVTITVIYSGYFDIHDCKVTNPVSVVLFNFRSDISAVNRTRVHNAAS